MTQIMDIYKCRICGNVVQVLIPGAGEIVCCGQEMKHLIPQKEENELGEKHMPKIETEHYGCESGVCKEKTSVKIDEHPMTKEHYIQFIEVYKNDYSELRIKFFNPEDKAEFDITDFGSNIKALELCNIHELWGNKDD